MKVDNRFIDSEIKSLLTEYKSLDNKYLHKKKDILDLIHKLILISQLDKNS